ncbi:phenylalanine-4-hydroxylase [Hymenobacter properus]|uniref:Phenylalanine-4-hydroxylase n=1 Tax=Hymenobacter properus TaxID=2791026 RepID=A0A931FJE3_9BACT|nr:phenylalanine-4-hydroxylase [Hymenobacter properus]MBF9140430.1 phenylalanine-4-hydroxylase [Hymenobacter properus]MBR7719237.1 phenylalanine 4-monooxygenase [Microvirga sp. SRT04]
MFTNPHSAAATQDQRTWKVLFDRQTALLHRRAAPAFNQGLARLGYRREAIPDIAELSAVVREETGWQLVPVGRPFEPAAFFALLADRKFPIVTRIRPMHNFDFSPEPDLFHDLFGHVPMLLDEGLANFLHELGQAYQAQPEGSKAREQLWALYFFTAEFGLVQHEGKPLLYGAGLLSSAGEIHHCVNENTPRPVFDLATVLRTPVTGARYQNQYFVLPAWEQLTECVEELAGMLASR